MLSRRLIDNHCKQGVVEVPRDCVPEIDRNIGQCAYICLSVSLLSLCCDSIVVSAAKTVVQVSSPV